jgi:fatty-acyl-CoA synthase
MRGLMMDYPLTLATLFNRARTFFGQKEIVTRLPDRSLHRYSYADFAGRSRRLSVALHRLGVQPGDRIGTLAWNTYQHLEAYYGIPATGAVLHTLNLRLHPDDLTYIINHAQDRMILVDEVLLPLYAKLADRIHPERVIVLSQRLAAPEGMLSYEALLSEADDRDFQPAPIDENDAAAMCYTSGTTGRPKGVLYSHRALVLHSLVSTMADGLGICEQDVILPVVPMFHVNSWGLPYVGTMVGAKLVLPGPFLDAKSLLDLLQGERVTLTAGVPTIWLSMLQELDAHPGAYDLSSIRGMLVGGSAAPRSLIEGFEKRHGLRVIHAWGMTETTPMGTVCTLTSDLEAASEDVQYTYRAKQGRPVPLVEMRVMGPNGPAPHDGTTMGELEVRGPWVAASYYEAPEGAGRFSADGWFRTGDIATIDDRGYMEIKDRAKDLIKSGGEWISSVALENALMGHAAIAEAAVIAVPDPIWQERPLAVVVLREGQTATAEDLRAFLEPQFARWWLPDTFAVVDQIPRTSAGKFAKSALRARFDPERPAEAAE